MFSFPALSLVLIGLAAQCAAKIIYAGVNSAGGEFAATNLPGTLNVDYQFINETHIDYFLENGVNVIRVTFLLERMCPPSQGLGATLNETYFSAYQSAVSHITMNGGYAILDAHNYMRYNDPSMQPSSGSIIGNTTDPKAATTDQLASFWGEFSRRFMSNPNVIFGIMNEPHDLPTELVLKNDQAMVDSIRATGAQQLILVPGNGFTGAEVWTNTSGSAKNTPSSEVMGNITDPMNNFAFDMHLYLDSDFSGTHNECVSATFGAENLVAATNWLQENNYTAFLSEFGGGNNPTCFSAVNNTLDFLEQNSQWIGWTYWTAGPLWGDYFLSVEPDEGPEFGSMWEKTLLPHVSSYQPVRRCGVSKSMNMDVLRDLEGCLGLKLVAQGI